LCRRLLRAGLVVNDNVFGLAWSGGMVKERLLRLIPHLPDGISEIYCHPAADRAPALAAAMPGYRHQEEFAALLSPLLKSCVDEHRIRLVTYSDLAASAADRRPAGD
jgi:predicted glycoside hydrolase/deacetylase ChbG (UPF0249 family)